RRFGGGVEGGGGFVEKQQRGVDHFGAGQGDELALAGGQAAAAFVDGVSEAAGDGGDGGQCADAAGGVGDGVFVGVGAAVGDVRRDGAVEQVGFLGYVAEGAAPLFEGE